MGRRRAACPGVLFFTPEECEAGKTTMVGTARLDGALTLTRWRPNRLGGALKFDNWRTQRLPPPTRTPRACVPGAAA